MTTLSYLEAKEVTEAAVAAAKAAKDAAKAAKDADRAEWAAKVAWIKLEAARDAVERKTPTRKDLIWVYTAGWNDGDRSSSMDAESFVDEHFPEAK